MLTSGSQFAYGTLRQTTEDWLEAINAALTYYGGYAEVILSDNDTALIAKPGKIPKLVRGFQDFIQFHPGMVAEVAAVRTPTGKAIVEKSVQLNYERTLIPMQSEIFDSLDHFNHRLRERCDEANLRPKKASGVSRKAEYDEYDKPHLFSLPTQRFEVGKWISRQKVGKNIHIFLRGVYYSVPYQLVDKTVEVRETYRSYEVYHEGARVCTHLKTDAKKGSYVTKPHHQSAEAQVWNGRDFDMYMNWARTVHRAVLIVVARQYASFAHSDYVATKNCTKLEWLCKKYGEERFINACRLAVKDRKYGHSYICEILKAGFDLRSHSLVGLQLKLPLDHGGRGSDIYR